LACAETLAAEGAVVWINCTSEQDEAQMVETLTERGYAVNHAAGDIRTLGGREQILAACPAPDILVNEMAYPSMYGLLDFNESIFRDAVDEAVITPHLLIRAFINGMIERKWGRVIIVNSLENRATLDLRQTNCARSNWTCFVTQLAREVAVHGVTINNVLPGAIDTRWLKQQISELAARQSRTYDDVIHELIAAIPAKRFGKPEEIGAAIAFLASRYASNLSGQDIFINGGE
jgi:3-oxoacyl-[acyl-carrier protein] reductase